MAGRAQLFALVLLGAAPAVAGDGGFPRAFRSALRADEVSVRTEAAKDILKQGRAALPEIRRALWDKDFRVRRRACRLLLRLGDERSIPALLGALARDDPSSEARVAIAWTAFRLGYPPALQTVKGELYSRWWHRRLNAVEDLSFLGDAGAASLIRRRLRDGVWLVRWRALKALRKFDLLRRFDVLVDLVTDREWIIREEAIRSLLALGAPSPDHVDELVGALYRALFDEEVLIRRLAARALSRYVAHLEPLRMSLEFSLENDLDPQVRGTLLGILAVVPPGLNKRAIRRAVRSPTFWLRASAAPFLHRAGERRIVQRLLAAVPQLKKDEIPNAARALRNVPDMEVLHGLLRGAVGTDRRAEIHQRLLAAMGGGLPNWTEAVRSALRPWLEATGRRRATAISVVGFSADRSMLPDVLRALASSDAQVQRAAALAAKRLGPSLPIAARERLVAGLLPSLQRPAANRSARPALVALLERGVSPAVLDALVQSGGDWTKVKALEALQRMGLGSEAALASLDDPASSVRAAAAAALGRAIPPSVGPPTASTTGTAISVEGEKSRIAIGALVARLRDASPQVRDAAAMALWRAGAPQGRRELAVAMRRRLKTGVRRVRRAAAGHLVQLASEGSRSAARVLVPLLIDRDPAIRSGAREVLGQHVELPELLAAARREDRLGYAAGYLLAAAGRSLPATATALAPIAKVGAAEVRDIAEYDAGRLADVLWERLDKKARRPALRTFLRTVLAPRLLADLAVLLGKDVETRWRGTGPYNMRRQNLYNAEIAAAVREFPGLHPKVLKALLYQESNLEPQAGNHFDCVGLGAFCRFAAREEGLSISDTFRDFRRDQRYHPSEAVRASVRHLLRKSRLLEAGPFRSYGAPRGLSYWSFVLAAYNGGHNQVGQAMREAYRRGWKLARAKKLRGKDARDFARKHASRWSNLLQPDEVLEESPLYKMTKRRYPWYRPYGRYRKMEGAEAKYHEIGQFPLDILTRAFEGERLGVY